MRPFKASRPMTNKSIRKRGYYRALKREEPWALMTKGMRDIANSLCRYLYADELKDYALKPSPFMTLLKKEEKLMGLSAWLPDKNEKPKGISETCPECINIWPLCTCFSTQPK